MPSQPSVFEHGVAPPIQVHNIGLQKNGVVILEPISITLTESRIAIVGRNGSGKTSLVHVIAGLEEPTQGRVQIGAIDVLRDRKAICSAVGVLFQNPDHQIIFPMVYEELSFGLRQMGHSEQVIRKQVQDMLNAYGRLDWYERSIATLSHGQKQLVCLLAVLLMQPATLILDEPFSGLDLPIKYHLNRIFHALPQRIVHITHDPASVADYDRVLWLNQGVLVGDGPPKAVLPEYQETMRATGERDAYADLPG